jgi:hypothetical protein
MSRNILACVPQIEVQTAIYDDNPNLETDVDALEFDVAVASVE